ncbi:hypothetical protein SAMN05444159_6832 [Bradyrhizobium lablabi]|uniref:Uncharacterized protein n=1 Tax=Bradyrhizobium lablabi TaxID=722472 RepID=A0A1M7DIH1_9BRAD|nr:hypothetical protein [Bradyrhizobium lablabi]SHL79272.1 hypothetical protein SAMN05444159_6832 [Bradyrhizobium lablabi]
MPVARYFMYVGGVLLALLFVINAYLPAPPPVADRADAELPVIRIHSARQWPKAVVFDTSQPAPAQIAKTETAAPAPATVADASAKARVRDAFAQLQPSDLKQVEKQGAQPDPKTAEVKTAEVKPQPKRRVAKRRVAPPVGPPTMLVAQQPHFGFGLFGNNVW